MKPRGPVNTSYTPASGFEREPQRNRTAIGRREVNNTVTDASKLGSEPTANIVHSSLLSLLELKYNRDLEKQMGIKTAVCDWADDHIIGRVDDTSGNRVHNLGALQTSKPGRIIETASTEEVLGL